jgi:hypothetical protein
MVWSCGGETGTQNIANKYLTAWKQYDMQTLRQMTDPGVVLDLGHGTLAGAELVLGPVEFAAGADADIEFNNVVVRGDTVEFELVEKSGIITACGLEELRHYPRLIFENGLLVKKGIIRETPNVRLYSEQMALLKQWVRNSRPDIHEKITNAGGSFKIDRESGENLLLMAKAWQESKLVE